MNAFMSTKHTYHLKALKELVEMISIGGLLAIGVDIGWVFHDIYVSDIVRPGLWAVSAGLITAFIISGYGLYQYHKVQVKKLLHERFLNKMIIQQQRNKYKKHKNES